MHNSGFTNTLKRKHQAMLDTFTKWKTSARAHTKAPAYSSVVAHTQRPSRTETLYPRGATQDTFHPAQEPLLGRYQVMDICTTGGFGDVLICWDTRLQRRVAIKRIAFETHVSSTTSYATSLPFQDTAIKDALAEARVSSMLAHPNIVTMYDFETDDAYAYLVMEYIDGMTLSELLDRVEGGTLTPDETSYVALSISKAIAYAHENRVLHLDIKPSNIMFDHRGNVKLCDFGMATLASATGYADARGGTVGYMPQEQIDGDLIDERCDVFAFASVIWQALCGRAPFAAADVDSSRKLMQKPPKPAFPSYRLDMPAVSQTMVEDILLTALEGTPQLRTSDVRTFGQEIAHVLGDSRAGKASIQELITQALADDEPTEKEIRDRLPLSFRYPWLLRATMHIATLITTLVPALFLSVHLGYEPLILISIALACILASIFAPLCAGIVPTLVLTWGLISSSDILSDAHMLVPLLLVVLCVGSYTILARTQKVPTTTTSAKLNANISTCMWVGALTGSPFVASTCAPLFLTPLLSAFVVGTSWFITHLTHACLYSTLLVSRGFNIGFCVQHLLLHTNQEELVALGICMVSAGLSSFIYRKTTSQVAHKLAQTIVLCAYVGSFILQGTSSIHVASGIWGAFGLMCTIFAVCLSVLMYFIADNIYAQFTTEEVESGS